MKTEISDGSSAPKNPAVKRNFLLMAALVVALGIVAFYANLWREKSRVAEVIVEGNRIIPSKDILMLAKVPSNALMSDLDLYVIEQRVAKNEYVKTVVVHRDVPNRVRISVEERMPVAAIANGDVYYLDAEGIVLPHVRSQFTFDLPVLTGTFAPGDFTMGKQIRVRNILNALQVLSLAKEIDEELYRNISEIRADAGRDAIFYTAESGVPVILGNTDVGSRLVKFDGFWKSVVAHRGADHLQYIDLRFEDQVVVRWDHNDGDVHS